MKVYRFFLKRTYQEILDMEAVLFISLKYQYVDDKNCLILYAWTTDKKLKNDFKRTRTDEFMCDKTDIPDEMFDEFKLDYKESRIEYRKIPHFNKSTKKNEDVLCIGTFAEFTVIEEFPEEILGAWIEKFCFAECYYLNDEYVEVLDTILYTYYHEIYWSNSDKRQDEVMYTRSYGLTPEGNSISNIIDNIDPFNMFVRLFLDFFREDNV